jgi:hypothetical protein
MNLTKPILTRGAQWFLASLLLPLGVLMTVSVFMLPGGWVFNVIGLALIMWSVFAIVRLLRGSPTTH